MLVQGMWPLAIAPELRQRLRVGGRLDRQGNVERQQGLARQMQVACQRAQSAVACNGGHVEAMRNEVQARRHDAAIDVGEFSDQAVQLRCRAGRCGVAAQDLLPQFEALPGRVDVFVAGPQDRLELLLGQASARLGIAVRVHPEREVDALRQT